MRPKKYIHTQNKISNKKYINKNQFNVKWFAEGKKFHFGEVKKN